MSLKNHAGAVLALLIIFSCCTGVQPDISSEEQEFLDSATQVIKTPISSTLITNFITEDGITFKERKEFRIDDSRIVINKDTIYIDSVLKDSTILGYDVVSFPKNKVRPHKIKIKEGCVTIDGVSYTENLAVVEDRKKKAYKIRPGDTRSVLMSKGIQEQFLPKIPQVGQTIIYYE